MKLFREAYEGFIQENLQEETRLGEDQPIGNKISLTEEAMCA